MADALHGRSARRQMFMERLFKALAPVVGPRVSFEANSGKGVMVLVSGSKGGAMFTRAAPWLPGLTASSDLTKTARGVTAALHEAVTGEFPGTTRIGPARPTVTRAGSSVRVQLYGLAGEPLPLVEVPLDEDGRQMPLPAAAPDKGSCRSRVALERRQPGSPSTRMVFEAMGHALAAEAETRIRSRSLGVVGGVWTGERAELFEVHPVAVDGPTAVAEAWRRVEVLLRERRSQIGGVVVDAAFAYPDPEAWTVGEYDVQLESTSGEAVFFLVRYRIRRIRGLQTRSRFYADPDRLWLGWQERAREAERLAGLLGQENVSDRLVELLLDSQDTAVSAAAADALLARQDVLGLALFVNAFGEADDGTRAGLADCLHDHSGKRWDWVRDTLDAVRDEEQMSACGVAALRSHMATQAEWHQG